MEVMEKIRENSTVPIIIMSAKDTDSDKTLGLGLGADDYITKPFSVTKSGTKVELTSKEFEILKLLLQNTKKVYTKEQIYSLVWNDTYFGDENAVNVHISRLRNKIEDCPREPQYVITVCLIVTLWSMLYLMVYRKKIEPETLFFRFLAH